MEAGQAVEEQLAAKAQQQEQQSQGSSGTPSSVLQFLPPSPPRPNPILEALHSQAAASGSACTGLLFWGGAPSAGELQLLQRRQRTCVWCSRGRP